MGLALSGLSGLSGISITQFPMISPVMTSNTTPAPYVVAASSFFPLGDLFEPWRAFDLPADGSGWAANFVALPHWFEIDLGEVWLINKLIIHKYSHPNQALRTWSTSLKENASDSYVEVAVASDIQTSQFPYSYSFTPHLGRFIRLDITDQNIIAAIGYIEIFGIKP